MKKRGLILGSLATAAAILLSGCTTGSVPEPGPEMGNATPEVSPEAVDPAGEIIALPAERAEVTDMERAGEIIALRSDTTLAVGDLEQHREDSATVLDIDAGCGDLAVTGETFTLPCDTAVHLIDAADPDLDEVRQVESPATVAAVTSTGELIVGNDQEETLSIYREGEDPETFPVEGPTTQLISVPVEDGPDSVVRTWNPLTLIQDVDWTNDRQGATLRVGIGVGQMAGGPDGLVIVSDNLGPQIAVYTADDIIRLHQTAPVNDSPWGVAWDEANDLAWIASTGTNTVTAYEISQGLPEEAAQVDSVADVHNIVVLADGTLVAASASGDGLQIVTDPLA